MSTVQPIPEGFHSVSPAMVIKNAAEAIDFYQKAFGAELIMRLNGPHDSIMHAEIRIGDSMIMIGEEWPGHHVKSPTSLNGTTLTLHIYVKDVDAAHKRAVAAGAKEIMAPTDMFWGDRTYVVEDLERHRWTFAQHTRDVAPEDMKPPA